MPKTVKTLDRKLNFVSITPGTSFNLRSSAGTAEERALIYVLLEGPWQFQRGGAGASCWPVTAEFESFAQFDRARPPRRSRCRAR